MKLALELPWNAAERVRVGNTGLDATRFADSDGNVTLGSTATRFGEVALYAGAVLMFLWALWGVFDYIKAEGNKESLAKARKKIEWAVVGFIILIAAFFVGDVLESIIQPVTPPLTKVTDPRTVSP